jgi:hypothetical protein
MSCYDHCKKGLEQYVREVAKEEESREREYRHVLALMQMYDCHDRESFLAFLYCGEVPDIPPEVEADFPLRFQREYLVHATPITDLIQ